MSLLLSFALAQASVPIAPLDGWAVYRDDAQTCVATRFYGTGDTPVVVRVRLSSGGPLAGSIGVDYPADWSAPPPTSIPVGASGPARPVPDTDGKTTGAVVIAPSGKSWPADVDYAMDQYRGSRSVTAWIGRDGVMALGTAATVRIDRRDGKPIAIAVGPVPVAALETCRLRILREWGVDPARLIDLPGDASAWFKADDYPMAARRAGAQGRVAAALDIAENGTIRSCRVVVSTGSKELDDATCAAALLRGSLAPAPNAGPRSAILRTFWRLQQD